MTAARGFMLFGLGAISMVPLIAYVRHRHRRELAGMMTPQSQIFQPSYGAVVDADIEDPDREQSLEQVGETPHLHR